MPVSKHLSRNRKSKGPKKPPVARTDANQGVIEHTERVRKQNAYIIRKLAEMRARQEEERKAAQAVAESSESKTIDGLSK